MVPCDVDEFNQNPVSSTPIKTTVKPGCSFLVVDPGYVNCGVAIWNSVDGFRYMENVKLVPSKESWTRVRVAESCNSHFDKLVSQICQPAEHLVVIMEEQPLKLRATKSIGSAQMKFTEGAILSAIIASARRTYSSPQLTIKTVSPVTVKASLGAVGLERFDGGDKTKAHDFNKKAMTRFVAAHWKIRGRKIMDHNIADCVGMLTWFILSNGAIVKKKYSEWSSLSLHRDGNDWTQLKPLGPKRRKNVPTEESS